MAEETIFSKIISKEIKADIVYEDDICLAFRDIKPQAPTHILMIPKKQIPKIADATSKDHPLMGHLLIKAAEVARKEGIEKDGYRLVINNGKKAGQEVFHLHIHILGGRDFSWPPG